MLSESVGAGDEARSRRILRLTILINSVVVTPLVMAIALMSPWLMSLYGESFSQAWPVLVISLATAGVLAVQSPVGQSLNAEGRLWTVFFLNLGWSLTFIAMTVLLRDRGAHGLVIARMVAYLFLGAGQFILAYGYKLTGPRNRSVADTVRS
jgi:O-antigen/teichoic acid export membrane protein